MSGPQWYYVVMEFLTSLKAKAQQIIELSDQPGERVHTWNQEESAPNGGYADRAGFIITDNVELYADVYVAQDETESLLRARLALSPKNEADQNLFTIITLDFSTELEKTKTIIARPDDLSQQTLVMLLDNPSTKPKLVHVSLESGKDSEGKTIGKRYEYGINDLQELAEADQTEFLSTLSKAYDQIVSTI